MSRLERPDALAQPAQQVCLLGESAEQRLAQVQVAMDEPGQHEAAGGIDGLVGALAGQGHQGRGHGVAHRGDKAVLDEQIATGERPGGVHAHQSA